MKRVSVIKKNKELLSDHQRRELIDLYPHYPNDELCEMFDITPMQLKTQAARLGLRKELV